MIEKITERLNGWFAQADRRSHGALGVLSSTAKRLGLVRAPEAAASLAYYALFTLFPLLILVVAVGHVLSYAATWSMGLSRRRSTGSSRWSATELIRNNLETLMQQRTSVGIFRLIALLWAASSFFAVLVQHINLAFPAARPGNVIRNRLFALLIVLLVLLLFMASLILSGITSVFRSAQIFSLLPTETVWETVSVVAAVGAVFSDVRGVVSLGADAYGELAGDVCRVRCVRPLRGNWQRCSSVGLFPVDC